MIEYDRYGDPDRCTHEYDGRDVSTELADEIEKAITEGLTSLRDRIRYLEGEVVALTHQRDQATKALRELTTAGSILADFAEWVGMGAADGLPASHLERRAQKVRAAAAAMLPPDTKVVL